MSYVTSVTVVVDYVSQALEGALLAPSDFGREEGYRTALRELDMYQAGGSKVASHRVFAAGLNYAARAALRAWADALPWGISEGLVFITTDREHPEVWVYGTSPVSRVVHPFDAS